MRGEDTVKSVSAKQDVRMWNRFWY